MRTSRSPGSGRLAAPQGARPKHRPEHRYLFKCCSLSMGRRSDDRLLLIIMRTYYANNGCDGTPKLWGPRGIKSLPAAVTGWRVSCGQPGPGVSSRRVRATFAHPGASRSPDLVGRVWNREAPDLVWASGFTHGACREGTVYVSSSEGRLHQVHHWIHGGNEQEPLGRHKGAGPSLERPSPREPALRREWADQPQNCMRPVHPFGPEPEAARERAPRLHWPYRRRLRQRLDGEHHREPKN